MINIHHLILIGLIILLGFFLFKRKIKVTHAAIILFAWIIAAHNDILKIKFYVELTVFQEYTGSLLFVNEFDKKEAIRQNKTKQDVVNEFHNNLLIDRYFRVDKGNFDLLDRPPCKREESDKIKKKDTKVDKKKTKKKDNNKDNNKNNVKQNKEEK